MRSVLLATCALGCQEYGLSHGQQPPTGSTDPTTAEGPVPGEPIADAGRDHEVKPLDTVRLDATRSHDPDGLDIVAVKWSLIEAPTGSTAELSDPRVAKPEVFVDLAGDYVFRLTVQNSARVWDSTPDEVTVTATPLDGFYVELSWDAANDLDLHLMHSGSELFTAGDCDYCNKRPSWNAAGKVDDPSLDWDVITGFGPETITIDDPSEDVYEVAVHYYGERGQPLCIGPCAQAEATVSVYISGSLAATYHHPFRDQGDLWNVAKIKWPSGQVTDVDTFEHTNRVTCR